MKTLIGSASNHSTSVITHNGKVNLVPNTEVVLVISESVYSINDKGEMLKSPGVETVRFCSTASVLRYLSKQCDEWADELEEMFGEPRELALANDEVDFVEVTENEIGENGRIEATGDDRDEEPAEVGQIDDGNRGYCSDPVGQYASPSGGSATKDIHTNVGYGAAD
jgi:hypothetical protein